MKWSITPKNKRISRTSLVSPLPFSPIEVEINKFTDHKPINFGVGFEFSMERRKMQEAKAIEGGNNFHKVSLIGLRIMKKSWSSHAVEV